MVSTSFITLLLPALALAAPWGGLTTRSGGGMVTLTNNCDYDVTYENACPCGTSDGSGTITAGSTWTDSLADCSSGNTALKIYANGGSSPMQFEYGIQSGNVWYDMSFINCVSGSDDFSQCAGSGWSMGSIGTCTTWACSGGSECCTEGYCDPTASAASQQPSAACGANQGYSVSDLGINIQLCAA